MRTNPNTIGFKNVFVPGDAKIYVAPELILHYIDQHGYAPPAEFQQAVLDCPTMRSVPYLQAILRPWPHAQDADTDSGRLREQSSGGRDLNPRRT